MKNKFLLIGALSSLMFVTSCSSDDDTGAPPELLTETIDCSTNVAAGETLTLENRNDGIDYIINCVYGINGDLIIKPGVTIQFGTDAGLAILNTGSIQALGIVGEPVLFTGEDRNPGSWRGIYIETNDIKNKMEFTNIEYAGGKAFNSNGDKGAVIVWSNSHLTMRNSVISNSETYGFNAIYGGDELVLENNTITNCNVPMIIRPNYVNGMVGGNYKGNGTNAIYLNDGFLNIDATFKDFGVPYHILSRLVVSAGGGKLTINPGVVMKFGLNASLVVDEGASGSKPSLVAVGTAQSPILFTGIDAVLGAWQGIYFDTPSALNEIGFATIEYASNPDQEGAIETWYNTVLNVHDVTFKDIQRCAIHQYKFPNDPNTLITSNLTYINVTNNFCQN
ncbi:hypothetical protein Aeqsu_2679 [Aequorivita sublithincola DSM 14238]|uniref:Right handed beta helix domain-containing protein n=1 Tax=Aequorivita sublithincola (strain DSM 14238 / LMG 21431 / ACAM 643 / 9-3) TaxID=746697 RepID=I3YYR4_AEQSU|nr:right-handed parallel beta-helix repeat-containing protein [Aequorivita sublithincola]AFL82132.1 hypothetical protein Aeqsu_2679 [Aequorivita sublithincola DSM 14238]